MWRAQYRYDERSAILILSKISIFLSITWMRGQRLSNYQKCFFTCLKYRSVCLDSMSEYLDCVSVCLGRPSGYISGSTLFVCLNYPSVDF